MNGVNQAYKAWTYRSERSEDYAATFDEVLAAGTSSNGAWSKKQLLLLTGHERPPSGWRTDRTGLWVHNDVAKRFIELKDAHLTGENSVNDNRPTRIDEVAEIAKDYLECHKEMKRCEEALRLAEQKHRAQVEHTERRQAALKKCVGGNIRIRNFVIDGSLVRVEMRGDYTNVTVEDIA